MMIHKKIALGISVLVLGNFLVSIPLVKAVAPPPITPTLKIGSPCAGAVIGNDSCFSGDCEEASDGKYYCDCNNDSDCADPREEYNTRPDETWKCVDDGRKDLDTCESNLRVISPLGNKDNATNFSMLTDKGLAGDEIKKLISKPQLKITIPGLTFSEPKVVQDGSGEYLSIPILGEYIKALYRYGLAAAGIFAVVIIINAGFLWVRSGGSAEVISKQKESIEKAIVGLIIAVTSYSILYFINPNLTKFESLKVQYVKTIPIMVDSAGDPPSSGPVTPGVGSNGVPYFAQFKGPWALRSPADMCNESGNPCGPAGNKYGMDVTCANPRPCNPAWTYNKGSKDPQFCATIWQRGCGPTSLAMVLSYYGQNVSPLDTGRWGLGCTGAWQAYATLDDFSRRWPELKMQIFTKKQLGEDATKKKVLGLLSQNKPLVYNCAPCQGFDASGSVAKQYAGHYVVLTGIHPDNKNYEGLTNEKIFLTVNDPGRNENSRIMTMTMSQVLQNFVVGIYVDKK